MAMAQAAGQQTRGQPEVGPPVLLLIMVSLSVVSPGTCAPKKDMNWIRRRPCEARLRPQQTFYLMDAVAHGRGTHPPMKITILWGGGRPQIFQKILKIVRKS